MIDFSLNLNFRFSLINKITYNGKFIHLKHNNLDIDCVIFPIECIIELGKDVNNPSDLWLSVYSHNNDSSNFTNVHWILTIVHGNYGFCFWKKIYY